MPRRKTQHLQVKNHVDEKESVGTCYINFGRCIIQMAVQLN